MHQNNHVIFGLNLLISDKRFLLQEDGLKMPVPKHGSSPWVIDMSWLPPPGHPPEKWFESLGIPWQNMLKDSGKPFRHPRTLLQDGRG